MSIDIPAATIKKWQMLVDLMNLLTASGKMNWSEGAQANTIVSSYGGHAIVLRKMSQPGEFSDDEPIIDVAVNDASGETIDQFTDKDLDTGRDYTYFRKLDNLMMTVRRKLSGAEEVLDSLLSQMKKASGKYNSDDEIPF